MAHVCELFAWEGDAKGESDTRGQRGNVVVKLQHRVRLVGLDDFATVGRRRGARVSGGWHALGTDKRARRAAAREGVGRGRLPSDNRSWRDVVGWLSSTTNSAASVVGTAAWEDEASLESRMVRPSPLKGLSVTGGGVYGSPLRSMTCTSPSAIPFGPISSAGIRPARRVVHVCETLCNGGEQDVDLGGDGRDVEVRWCGGRSAKGG